VTTITSPSPPNYVSIPSPLHDRHSKLNDGTSLVDDRVEATTVEAGGRRKLAKEPSKRRRIVRRDRTERFHGD
jgi:hypothetical protein